MLPLLAERKDANHDSPPVISSFVIEMEEDAEASVCKGGMCGFGETVAFNSQLEHSEPEVTTTEHEDSSGLGQLATTHTPSSLFSKDVVLLGGYYKILGHFRTYMPFYMRHMINSALGFPSVHPGRSTAADTPPNPGMLHIPAIISPVSGDPPLPPWTMPRRNRPMQALGRGESGFRTVSTDLPD
jgi:hypothetical protein